MQLDRSIYAQLEQDIASMQKPRIVGIGGAYTSGKTVFCENLANHLTQKGYPVQAVHYDDFHHPLPTITWTQDAGSEVEAFYDAFNMQKLIDELLLPLKRDGSVKRDIACLNWDAGAYTTTLHFDIGPDTVALLEGVLIFRPPLASYIGYRVFLDISFEEMLRRGRLRDVPQFGEEILEKYKTRYIPVFKKHLEQDEPRENAHALIGNNDYAHPILLRRAEQV